MENEEIEVIKNGLYSVEVLDANNCPASLEINIDSLSDFCNNLNYSIHPNTTDGNFNLEFNTCAKPVEIHIYDMSGKRITVQRLEGLNTNFNLTHLSKGQYVIKAVSGNNVNTKILSIQ